MNGRRYALAVLIGAVFLGLRLLLLYARDPFFDEMFTLWMARQPFTRIIPNLLHDSGPPLYYFVARFDSITALRLLSLLFASLQFALVLRRSLLAAALLAVYPPAVLLSVDARAYALCALFVTIGILASEDDRPMLAACALALAAYSHYYGVLFFPCVILSRADGEGSPATRGSFASLRMTRGRVLAFLLAVLLFVPGFMLAINQPREATQWIRESVIAPLLNLSMAGRYPYSLLAALPMTVIVTSLLLLVAAVARSLKFAVWVLVPLALVIVFQLAGRPAYFPLRFESIIAAPLMLWAAGSLARYPLIWRRAIAGALIFLGALSVYLGVIDHLSRPTEPHQYAVLVLKNLAKPHDRIVATGYCYLLTLMTLDRPVQAWPAEQAEHPGWRSFARPDPKALPESEFLWIGEKLSPELPVLRGVRRLQPLFINERVILARAQRLTPPVH